MYKELKSPALIITIVLCVYLSFIESLHGATLWGLNWQSPKTMGQLREYLRFIKLGLIAIAVFLLIARYQSVLHSIKNKMVCAVFLIMTWILIILQVPMLLLGIMFFGISDPRG